MYGFNNKLPALLSKILETAKSFLPTDDRFKVNMIFLSANVTHTCVVTNYFHLFLSGFRLFLLTDADFFDRSSVKI